MRQIIWMEHTKSKAGRESKKKIKDAKRLSHHGIMQYIVHTLTKPNSTTNSLL